MNFSVFEQFNILIYSVFVGVAVALLFKISGFICKKLPWFISFLPDFVSSLISAALLFIFILVFSKGEFRLHQLLSVLSGILLFNTLFKKS